jgi:regulator of RNase E activity RraA
MDVSGLKCADRYNLANLFHEAVGDEPAGKVVVLASNGYTDTSMGGGTKLLRLHQNGCAGVLTDGRLRIAREDEAHNPAPADQARMLRPADPRSSQARETRAAIPASASAPHARGS